MSAPFRPEHAAVRARLRAFVERELRPQAERWERAGRLPRRTLSACARNGCMSPDPWQLAIVAEELARCDSLGVALSVFVQGNLLAPLLETLGTAAQKARWLDGIRRGTLVGALAVTEPEAGSDFGSLSATGRRRRAEIVVRGVKTYVTNGAAADLLVVAVRTDGPGPAGLSLVVVPRATPGVRVERLRPHGLATSAMGRIEFDGCRVPADALLGKPGRGFGYVMQALDRERLFGALAAVAWASYAIERTIAWTQRRRVFGRPLSKVQVVRHQLADAVIALEAARQLNYATLTRWTAGEDVAREIAMIKVFSYQAAQQAIDRCMHLHGGAGYMADHWTSRFHRDARALTLAAGTPEVMKELVAVHLRL